MASRREMKVTVILLIPDTVPIPFPQDLVMSVPEICGERNIMWFLSSEMVRLPVEWHMKH